MLILVSSDGLRESARLETKKQRNNNLGRLEVVKLATSTLFVGGRELCITVLVKLLHGHRQVLFAKYTYAKMVKVLLTFFCEA